LSPCPDQLWDPPSLLSNGCQGQSSHSMKLTIHLHVVLRLRMCGAILDSPIQLHDMAKGQHYLLQFFFFFSFLFDYKLGALKSTRLQPCYKGEIIDGTYFHIKIYKRVKLSLHLMNHHTTNMYGGITPYILNLGTRWKQVIKFTSATLPLVPTGKEAVWAKD
jgi:hypothetical protein